MKENNNTVSSTTSDRNHVFSFFKLKYPILDKISSNDLENDVLLPKKLNRDSLDFLLSSGESLEFEDFSAHMGIKKLGDVYTPPRLVDYILDMTNYVSNPSIANKKILDPSCGFGSFLRGAVTRLRDAYIREGFRPNSYEDALRIMRGIETHVAGIEVNPTAAHYALLNYLTPVKDILRVILKRDPNYLPRPSIYEFNALASGLIPAIGLDFIVGNPPYVRYRDMPASTRNDAKYHFATATGIFDMYVLFFEIGMRWLREKGNIAFVTPDRFLNSDYGHGIRDLLLKTSEMLNLIRLPKGLFRGVITYPLITVATKNSNSNSAKSIRYLDLSDKSSFDFFNISDELKRERQLLLSHNDLGDGPWRFSPHWANVVITNMLHNFPPLKNMTTGFHTGVATGHNGVFVFDGRPAFVESDLLVPVLVGSDIEKGQIKWSGHYLLNTIDAFSKPINLTKYPLARSYLEKYKSELELRYHVRKTGKRWYLLHDPVNLQFRRLRKIVAPDISESARFAVDNGEFMLLNTCHALVCRYPDKTEVLTAILNSALFEFLVNLFSPRLGTRQHRYTRQYLENLPVPDISAISDSLTKELISSYRKKDWVGVDEIVFELCMVPKKVEQQIYQSISQNSD